MKKILSLAVCVAMSACASSENQWETVDNVTFEEVPCEEKTVVTPQPVIVPAPQVVYDAPCAEVQPCCNSMYMQPCGCQAMPAPQPKVTKTRKIITTTTTVEEPCGKEVCEPVVTTHEEIVPVDEVENITAPSEVVVKNANVVVENANVIAPAEVVVPSTVSNQPTQVEEVAVETPKSQNVEVTVNKNPYRSEVVDMTAGKAMNNAIFAKKYSPEVYNVVATRATNRMLQDTSAIYDNGKVKTVYIKDTKLLSSDLPYGSHRLKGATKDLISGSKTFDIVNNVQNADFVIETSAEWYVGEDNTAPALQYKLSMFDKKGKKVNDWIEIIRQVQE